jgi:predicted aspartyl protease
MTMGSVYADIEIVNFSQLDMARRNLMDMDEVKRMHVNIMVDSGALLLCINENIQSIFDFPFVKRERLELADGSIAEYDVVGPVEVKYGNRRTICEAFVLPGSSQPLLGAIPMESLNVFIHPQRWELFIDTQVALAPSIKPVGYLKGQ